MLEHFIKHGNDYIDVYRGLVKKDIYPDDNTKYREFTHWQPVN